MSSEREFEDDPYAYARHLDARLRDWVRKEINDVAEHNRRQRQQLGEFVGQHGQALSPQGWVAITMRQHETDISSLQKSLGEDGWVKRMFEKADRKASLILVTAVGILISVVTLLVGQNLAL